MSGMDRLTEYAVMLGLTNEPLPEGWTVHKGDGCVYFRDGSTVRMLDLEGLLRELLARRRASQAAPAPSDGLREALERLEAKASAVSSAHARRGGIGFAVAEMGAAIIAARAALSASPAQEGGE
jgi:hypothetical protein